MLRGLDSVEPTYTRLTVSGWRNRGMAKKAPPRDIKDNKTTPQLVEEYLKREAALDVEIDDLRASKKDLKAEFKDRIDLKVLAKAQRVVKVRQSVEEKEEGTFQEMLDLMDADLQFRVAMRQAAG